MKVSIAYMLRQDMAKVSQQFYVRVGDQQIAVLIACDENGLVEWGDFKKVVAGIDEAFERAGLHDDG